MELYNMVIQGYNASLAEQRGDQRHGLERFEAGARPSTAVPSRRLFMSLFFRICLCPNTLPYCFHNGKDQRGRRGSADPSKSAKSETLVTRK